MTEPDASIVVVAHNETHTLRPTLERLLETTANGGAEIVVVDDASTDGSTAFLADGFEGARLVRSESRLGISRARNLGAQVTAGPVIVFSDAHVDVEKGWLESLCGELARPGVGEVAPAVGFSGGSGADGYGFTWRDPDLTMKWITKTPAKSRPVPFVCGCFLAVRRDVFETCSGFDEGLVLWGSEDAEFSLRIWRLGWECRVVPAARVEHLFRKRFPYQVSWEPIVHNALRTAIVHLGERGLAAVIARYARNAGFTRATAQLATSDVWRRREQVTAMSSMTTGTFLARFGIEVVA